MRSVAVMRGMPLLPDVLQSFPGRKLGVIPVARYLLQLSGRRSADPRSTDTSTDPHRSLCGRVSKARSFSKRIRSSRDISARAHRENFPYSVLLPASGLRSKVTNRLDGACRGFLSRNP